LPPQDERAYAKWRAQRVSDMVQLYNQIYKGAPPSLDPNGCPVPHKAMVNRLRYFQTDSPQLREEFQRFQRGL
jgi:hypothetical protein